MIEWPKFRPPFSKRRGPSRLRWNLYKERRERKAALLRNSQRDAATIALFRRQWKELYGRHCSYIEASRLLKIGRATA